VVVGGISKTANAMGWRCGWLLAPASAVVTVTAVHQAVCSCAPTPGQAAALATMRALTGEGPGGEEFRQNFERFRDRRDRAVAALSSLGLQLAPTEGAFYVFAHVAPKLADENELQLAFRLLEQEQLIVIPGRAFGDRGRGWIRLAYTVDDVEEGVRRLGAALARGR
jgi:aspartate/methionine/tyrosine aminotransferase